MFIILGEGGLALFGSGTMHCWATDIADIIICLLSSLGGGGLALFGSGTMHCWATDIADILVRFTDTRKMDRTRFMDDSAYRYVH